MKLTLERLERLLEVNDHVEIYISSPTYNILNKKTARRIIEKGGDMIAVCDQFFQSCPPGTENLYLSDCGIMHNYHNDYLCFTTKREAKLYIKHGRMYQLEVNSIPPECTPSVLQWWAKPHTF